MDTERTTLADACPNAEELSAFYDQQGENPYAEHIDGCKYCQNQLAAFRQIEWLTQELTRPPEGLARRINGAIRKMRNDNMAISLRRSTIWPRLSHAAAWMLVALLGGLLIYSSTRRYQPREQVIVTAVNTAAAALANNSQIRKIETPLPDEGFTFHNQPQLNGNVETSDLRNVSTGMNVPKSYSSSRRHTIASRVRHIWLTDDLSTAERVLESAARQSGCALDWQDNDQEQSLVAILSASDKNIQLLVNGLYANGLQLLSPSYPQPQAERKAAFTGNSMLYQIVLVQKE